MVIENVFQRYGFDDIVAFTGTDITDKMIEMCMDIDRNFYQPEYAWDSHIKSVVKTFNQFCFVFIDKSEKRIVGYSFWFPIKTTVFNKFIKEKKMLLYLKEEHCVNFKNEKGTVNLFQGGEAYVPGYDLENLHKAVRDLFQSRVLDLAKIGIKVKYVAIDACCKFDETFLVKHMGLTKSVKKENSTFYYDDYSPNKVFSDSFFARHLQEYYK